MCNEARRQPIRKCSACWKRFPKNELLKIVYLNGSFSVDYRQKMNGRGAYVCKNEECIRKLNKTRGLNRSFKTNVPQQIYDELIGSVSNE